MKLSGLLVSVLALGGVPRAAAQGRIPVTGAPVNVGATTVPVRKNINDLQAQGGPQWYARFCVELAFL
jgi:hypothetical protein